MYITTCVCSVPAAIQRNLILRFKDDTIDDSLQLTQLLQNRWDGLTVVAVCKI